MAGKNWRNVLFCYQLAKRAPVLRARGGRDMIDPPETLEFIRCAGTKGQLVHALR